MQIPDQELIGFFGNLPPFRVKWMDWRDVPPLRLQYALPVHGIPDSNHGRQTAWPLRSGPLLDLSRPGFLPADQGATLRLTLPKKLTILLKTGDADGRWAFWALPENLRYEVKYASSLVATYHKRLFVIRGAADMIYRVDLCAAPTGYA
jgi:hypothetical protein